MRTLTGHAIIATPAAAPVHWRGVPVLFFIVTSVDARTNIYIRLHPLGPLPSCHCAVSCLVSPCDSAPKTADCRPPTVDDCRPLAPDPSLARPSLQASKLPWNRQPLDPLIQASCSRPTSPGSNRQPLLPESQPRLGNSSREQSSRLSFFSPWSRDSLSSALRLHYMSPQSLLCPSISRGTRKHASQD